MKIKQPIQPDEFSSSDLYLYKITAHFSSIFTRREIHADSVIRSKILREDEGWI
jgi:hypothetical protein